MWLFGCGGAASRGRTRLFIVNTQHASESMRASLAAREAASVRNYRAAAMNQRLYVVRHAGKKEPRPRTDEGEGVGVGRGGCLLLTHEPVNSISHRG